jgi:hypothetical protein
LELMTILATGIIDRFEEKMGTYLDATTAR